MIAEVDRDVHRRHSKCSRVSNIHDESKMIHLYPGRHK